MKSKIFSFLLLFLLSQNLSAHCDTEDGPVVQAALKALDNRNINLVLMWIQEKDEPEVRKAFEETLSVRELSPSAKVLADKYFFETVVRLHRSGEGEPYTGIKPAGSYIDPVILHADNAIETNSLEELTGLLLHSTEERLKESFNKVISGKNYDLNNPASGREYVEAYVHFIHFAEKLYELNTETSESEKVSEINHKHH